MTTGQLMWIGAWKTVATLFGGLLVGILLGNLTFNILPGANVMDPQIQYALIAAIPTLIALAIGSAAWGRAMARLAGADASRRMSWAGILGFAPITIILAFSLLGLEPIAVERLGARFPIHRLFTFLFVPTAFLISAVSAWAIGNGLRDIRLSRSLAWRTGARRRGCLPPGERDHGSSRLGCWCTWGGGARHHDHGDVTRKPRRGACRRSCAGPHAGPAG